VRTIATWVTGLLLASVSGGCCCCGGGCGGCAGSPIPYSAGNPYECGSGNFWGVGYYCQQYGFLSRRDIRFSYARVSRQLLQLRCRTESRSRVESRHSPSCGFGAL